MAKKRQYQDMKIGLNEADRKRLFEIARASDRTKTEVGREAIRWYLDNEDNLKNASRDHEIAESIKYATDQIVKAINSGVERICKMLARQGTHIGALYELSWMALPDDPKAVEAFEAAVNSAKQKMRKSVEKDEAKLASSMKSVVKKK